MSCSQPWIARLSRHRSAVCLGLALGSISRRIQRLCGIGVLAAVLLAAAAPAAAAPARAVALGHGQPPAAMLGWGDNSAGQLGDGTLTPSVVPTPVTGLAGVRMVAAGGRHELAVTASGSVVAWGDDAFGQLGNGVASASGDNEVPVAVPGLSGVTAVAAGEEHSLALLKNGTVMAWGDGSEGQLGDGSTATSAVPVPVKNLTGVTAIAAGGLFSLALLSNGTVMAWGDGGNDQLGDGRAANSSVPVPVKNLTGVTAIAAGSQHALALLSNGKMMAWGDNELGQLGDGSAAGGAVPVPVVKLTGVRAIAAGYFHSLALLSNGTVMVWGENSFSELARPESLLDSDVPLTVPGLGKATAIAASGMFSLAIVAGGKVEAWGDNAAGQLGNGTVATNPPPTLVKGLSGVTAIVAGGVQAFAFRPAAGAAAQGLGAGPVSSPWRQTANPATVCLGSVSAASATDAWATAPCATRPLAAHWTGKAWAIAALPLPGHAKTAVLNGVDELNPSNVWAVGNTAAGAAVGQRTLIEHWDGTHWAVVPSPNPQTATEAFDELTGIAGTSPDDLWAIGSYSNDTSFVGMLLEHWNGTRWTFVHEPTALHGSTFGSAVTVLSPTDAWAVGEDTFGDSNASAHWDGHVWTSIPTPALHDGNSSQNNLTGVTALAADNVWASGSEGSANDQNFNIPYMLHWNGKIWSLTKTPNTGSEGSQLNGVAALSPTDIWAAGKTGTEDGSSLTLTEHFDGRSWSIVPSLDPGELGDASSNSFSGIASAAPHVLFTVGSMNVPPITLAALAERTTAG